MLLLPTAYLAPVRYYAMLYHAPEVRIEACEHFIKQTLRSRCLIATDHGTQTLSVCVQKEARGGHQPIGEVRLSDHGNWMHQHLYSLATYYGNTPFFDYYIDDLRQVMYDGHDGTLMGLNEALRRHICSEIGFTPRVTYTDEWAGQSPVDTETGSVPVYYQVASCDGRQPFLENVSIVDLLFNMGPEAIAVLDRMKI